MTIHNITTGAAGSNNELLLRGRKERGLGSLPPEKFWDHALQSAGNAHKLEMKCIHKAGIVPKFFIYSRNQLL